MDVSETDRAIRVHVCKRCLEEFCCTSITFCRPRRNNGSRTPETTTPARDGKHCVGPSGKSNGSANGTLVSTRGNRRNSHGPSGAYAIAADMFWEPVGIILADENAFWRPLVKYIFGQPLHHLCVRSNCPPMKSPSPEF